MVIPLRLLKHWRASKKLGHRLFPGSTLDHFNSIMEEGALKHRAHLKLAIEVALPTRAILRNTTARIRACALFEQHCHATDTQHSHILIYINLADRQVEIVADPVVAQILTSEQWQLLCSHITHGFSIGDPGKGVNSALHELNILLEQTLPEIDGPASAPMR